MLYHRYSMVCPLGQCESSIMLLSHYPDGTTDGHTAVINQQYNPVSGQLSILMQCNPLWKTPEDGTDGNSRIGQTIRSSISVDSNSRIG